MKINKIFLLAITALIFPVATLANTAYYGEIPGSFHETCTPSQEYWGPLDGGFVTYDGKTVRTDTDELSPINIKITHGIGTQKVSLEMIGATGSGTVTATIKDASTIELAGSLDITFGSKFHCNSTDLFKKQG